MVIIGHVHALKTGIISLPDIIKLNIHELSRLVHKELKDLKAIVHAAMTVHNLGIKTVLVSLDAKGTLLVGDNKTFIAVPPKVKVVNTIGAGDSAVAGFVFGQVNREKLSKSLAYAVAAGTSTTLRAGKALCRNEDFLKLVPKVIVKQI
jgi:6-phosphofructokinase 2